jgi:4-carboxymuconolactone decarboxylase
MLIRFETLQAQHLIGQMVENPVFSTEETSHLWRGFRSRLKELSWQEGDDLVSIQVFSENKQGLVQQRWAAARHEGEVPEGMQCLKLPAGLYAVFLYWGGRQGFEEFILDKFRNVIPSYSLQMDERPHFQRMGPAFNPFSDESEEEVWIPVKPVSEGLAYRLKSISSMSALLSLGHQMDELRHRMELALETGFSLSDLKEIILQICLYAGFPRSLNGMACLRGLMESRNQRGQHTEEGVKPSPQPEGISRYKLGWDTLQSLDPEFIHRLKAGLDPISPELFSLVLEHGYADIFYRDNLDIRQREAAVVAAMVAVENADPQLSFHILAAMGTGIERGLMTEIIHDAAAAAGKNPEHAIGLLNNIV